MFPPNAPPAIAAPPTSSRDDVPRVVVVGAGFGGVRVVRDLASVPVDVLVVDRANHHLFRPLLYQVATAGLSPESIALPIRELTRGDAEVYMAEICGGDPDRRVLFTSEGGTIGYDYLVLATGNRPSFFGNDHWREHLFHLGSLAHAISLREHLIETFERVVRTHDQDRRRRLLNFVVIGGGPTGVELAGALAELGRGVIPRDMRHLEPTEARVILLEMSDRILPPFDADLSAEATRMLEELGVEVRCGARVTDVDAQGVEINGEERIESATVCWASGVGPVPLGAELGLTVDDKGAIVVGDDLSVDGRDEVFAIGDGTTYVPPGSDTPLPGLAPVAMQQGRHVAKVIRSSVEGRRRPRFDYTDKGMLATVGRSRAVFQRNRAKAAGTFAWLLWCVVHVWYLAGFRNRIRVVLGWMWQYLRYSPGARVLTREAGRRFGEPQEALPPPSRAWGEPSDAASLRPSVLLAEDDDELRELMAARLRKHGCEVVECRDGLELADRLNGTSPRRATAYDLLITDIHLPGMSGLSALAALREDSETFPVIVITGAREDRVRQRVEELGSSAFLLKPFELDELLVAVDGTLAEAA